MEIGTRNNNPPIILDDTLRDGGYLNDWKFVPDQVFSIARQLDLLGISIIEVGYINDDPVLGETARCSPSLLKGIRGAVRNAKIAVMLRPANPDARSVLEAREGLIDFVRMPCDLDNIESGIELGAIIHEYGMMNSINLISITAYDEEEVLSAIRTLASEDAIDCIYLSDSRGSITPDAVVSLVRRARAVWKKTLGFHGHDNLELAVENSRRAVEMGCDIVDGSIEGVGLGGGNTRLDSLISILPGAIGASGNHEEVLRSLSVILDLPRVESHEQYLYRLSGEKNLEQEWVPILEDRYGEETARFIEDLPRGLYKTIKDIL
jgi:4-hydroxy 2-oxovalerate aldolase